jgi:hypothetical protein
LATLYFTHTTPIDTVWTHLPQGALRDHLPNEHVAAGSMRLLHLLDSIGQQFYLAIVREVFDPTKKFDRLFPKMPPQTFDLALCR